MTTTIDEYRFIDEDEKLTEEGRLLFLAFRHECLVPDDEGRLSTNDIEEAFAAYPRGFSLDRASVSDVRDIIINGAENYRWLPPGLPYLEENLVRPVISFDDTDYLYRARLQDSLLLSPFNRHTEKSTEIRYLVDRLLPEPGVHMILALPEALKTWFGLHVAVCVSQGRPVLGRFETNQKPFERCSWQDPEKTNRRRSVVVDFEVGHAETARRLARLGADERLFHTSFPKYKLVDERFWTELQKLRPRFVFVDSLSAGCGAEFGELDNRFAEPLGRAARFGEEHGCTFLFAHHSPKSPTLNDPETLFRGSGAIRSKVDSAYYLRKLPDGPGGEKRADVSSAKSRKGVDPEKFAVQLTDERGLELFEPTKRKREAEPEPETEPELTDKDKVLRAIAAEPDGVSRNEAPLSALEMGRDRVSELLHELVEEQRIRIEGKGRATRCFVAPTTT